MSTVAVIVDCNACAWGKLSQKFGGDSIQILLQAIVSYCNAHLAMSASNRLVVFAYGRNVQKKLLFSSTSSPSKDVSSTVIEELRRVLVASANDDDCHIGSLLAPALAQAICYMKRRETGLKIAEEDATKDQVGLTAEGSTSNLSEPSSRAVVIGMTSFFGGENSSLMNLFFSAAKQSTCVDVVSVGDDATGGILQQAADITGGLFLHAHKPSQLIGLLMTHVLAEPRLRKIFPQPSLVSVDYRASCACHNEMVSTGWVCSVCLSVLCQFSPICKVCSAVFKIQQLAKKPTKRKKPIA